MNFATIRAGMIMAGQIKDARAEGAQAERQRILALLMEAGEHNAAKLIIGPPKDAAGPGKRGAA